MLCQAWTKESKIKIIIKAKKVFAMKLLTPKDLLISTKSSFASP